MNRVVIGLGSNIEPEKNIEKARAILAKTYHTLAESHFKTTKPYGEIQQADFINGATLIMTELTLEELKAELNEVEVLMGRKRTDDRYGPRVIDLDVIVWNGEIIDQHFYERDYLKESALELIPDLNYQKNNH